MSREVLVTGFGTVGAYGYACESLAAALELAAPVGAREVDRSAGRHRARGARRALLAPLSGLTAWLPPLEARRMSLPSRFSVAAARMAWCRAGLPGCRPAAGREGLPPAAPVRDARADPRHPAEQTAEETAVVMATAFGPCSFAEALLRQILGEGPESASPYLFTESVANAAAAQIAIACRARGPSITICQREAGALQAVGCGAAEVASGRVVRALVGTVDELPPLHHALLDRFGALARPRAEPSGAAGPPGGEEAARPFDRRRNGILAAEGATVLVLEEAEAARRRGARPLCRVLAWGSAFDPSAPPAGWGRGHAVLSRALLGMLARAGLLDWEGAPAARIDRIVSGASGSRSGDRLEAHTLRTAWNDRPLPPVLAPKGAVGEYGGGFLGAAVLAAAGAPFGPTCGFAEPDPELGVVPHDGSALAPPAAVLVSSLAAGGAASWLVLGAAG
ncbi:MAG TPA: beta-ketoacyl synthase N-terminal-like domain-containing protein [Thermoanaerobaculia bacterium]|nr:beta-ketoacyl synthase N-terminal-like domain-containing protein [Thermoanaerobaculia bacterium]